MSDYLVRAIAANGRIRAFAAVTTQTVEKARISHNTSPVVTAALGRLLTAGLIMLAIGDIFMYTAIDILKIYGIVLLGSVLGTIILMLFASFFKKSSTLGSFGILISAAIGFVIGAYIPVSQFGEGVQTAVNLVPWSQVAGMMRNVLMTPAIDNINNALGGIDNGMFVEEVENTFALNLNIFGDNIGINFMLIYSLASIAIFLVLNLVSYKVSSKRKA